MENLESILKSILPLIIIIAVSWLFSSLGSRMRKRAGQGQEEAGPADKIFDFMDETGEEAEMAEPVTTEGRPPDMGTASGKWWTGYPPQGPQATPKPITPKWWGA